LRTFKRILAILFALFLVLALLGGFATYDYGLVCTRCLYHEHHAQQRLFGISLWSRTLNCEDEYGKAYLDVFQHPCTHVLKKGGFGYRSGCGITAEGSLFYGRNRALRSLFEAYKRVGDRNLATNCFTLIEKLFPDQTTVETYYARRSQGIEDPSPSILVVLAAYLDQVETPGEWAEVNTCAEQAVSAVPPFTQNEQVLRAKLNSPSPIVREAVNWQLQGLLDKHKDHP
jgi:hypothetical protein